MASTAMRPDPFVRAHQDAHKAVALFLPSVVGRQETQAPPPPPNPMAPPLDSVSEAMRVISLANRGEKMSARVARGLPAEEPQSSPEREFGNQLDSVHTRAIQEAIAAHPEEDRGRLISEAHDSAVKWIAAHNGKVVVHGKIELAHSPESAERLAAKIVNNEVEGHDQRKAAEANVRSGGDGSQGVDGASTVQGAQLPGPVPHIGGEAGQPTPDSASAAGSGAGTAGPMGSAVAAGGTQPEIVPPGDGEPPATGAPPAVTQPEAQQVGTRKGDGHQITQPKNSIASNQRLALDAAPELHQALQTLSAQVPGTKFDRLRPQKSTDRLDQKVEDANDPNTLSDYLGAQVSADTPQAKDAMVAALKKGFKVIEVDDQFLKGRKDKAQYPSTNVQVQLRNGMTAEVQIVPREVQDATEQSHAFYKAGREAEDRGDNAERDRQWKQAGDINQGALGQFKQRNGIADQPKGLLESGNIDLYARPKVKNPDGSVSTVRSIGIDEDGKEVVIPTVVGNRVVSDKEAIAEYRRTGKHLGKFDTPENGDRFAEQLHNDYAAGKYDQRPSPPSLGQADAPLKPPSGLGDYEIMGEPIKVGKHTFLRVKQGGQNGATDDGTGARATEAVLPQDGGAAAAGPVSDGDGAAGARAPAGGPVTKGQKVVLKDGTPAEVTYIHPELNAIRVRTADGQNLRLNPKELASAAAE